MITNALSRNASDFLIVKIPIDSSFLRHEFQADLWISTPCYYAVLEFFLNNTNLTFLVFLYKIYITGFQNQQKKMPPLGIELTTPTPLLEFQLPYPLSQSASPCQLFRKNSNLASTGNIKQDLDLNSKLQLFLRIAFYFYHIWLIS